MSKVLGIDPGVGGALAIYNDEDRSLIIWNMPTWYQVVGRKKRKRVDAIELLDMMEVLKDTGCDLAVMEGQGGMVRGRQSGQFAFGYTVGLIYMALVASRIPIETSHPATWKRLMRVPRDNDGIVQRFGEIFPEYRSLVRGPKGAIQHDRAEAAMLAKFGAEHLLHTSRPDVEWRMIVKNAETGA